MGSNQIRRSGSTAGSYRTTGNYHCPRHYVLGTPVRRLCVPVVDTQTQSEVPSEVMANYYYGRKILEAKGWIFTAAVIDGRRGLATVFKDIPVQICHFHQLQTVTKYLTRKPKTDAGRELRFLALTLTKTDEATFTKALLNYEEEWSHFLNEKTIILGLNRPQYTHKNVRAALRSLKTNLQYLFTYLRYPELGIPNTTNTIDGYFASVKKKVAAHHGLRKDRRFKLICQLLKEG